MFLSPAGTKGPSVSLVLRAYLQAFKPRLCQSVSWGMLLIGSLKQAFLSVYCVEN